MKEIKAIIKPFKINEILNQLLDTGYPNLTVTLAEGTGNFKGYESSLSTNIFTISDRTININRKVAFYNFTAGTLAPINPVFSNYLFDCGYINNLSFPKKLIRQITYIFPSFRTKTRKMFNNLIGCFCHLQRFAFMSGLSACFNDCCCKRAQ